MRRANPKTFSAVSFSLRPLYLPDTATHAD